MRPFFRVIYRWLIVFGVDPQRAVRAARGLPRYFRERRRFRQLNRQDLPRLGASYPILHENGEAAGEASGHYFHMDLWAAKKIFAAQPDDHLDIGSRLDGFVSHLLCFRPVTVIDIRPLASEVEGLKFLQADATRLTNIADQTIESISCLHAAEHFGLGRYGDAIDPTAYRELLSAIARVLRPGGRLYFAVPVGRERVEFNAHRVFDPRRIINELLPLELVDFSAVGDDGRFISTAKPEQFADAYMSCGLYEFRRPIKTS